MRPNLGAPPFEPVSYLDDDSHLAVITPELRRRIDEVKARRPGDHFLPLLPLAPLPAPQLPEEPPSLLTAREQAVIQLIADGLDNRDTAERIHFSTETVKDDVRHILAKLGAHNRAHAVALAYQQHLLTVD